MLKVEYCLKFNTLHKCFAKAYESVNLYKHGWPQGKQVSMVGRYGVNKSVGDYFPYWWGQISHLHPIPHGLVVRIPAFHAGGPGSIPGVGVSLFFILTLERTWGVSFTLGQCLSTYFIKASFSIVL